MKVIILAGGFGTRISEYTQSIPKPMIEIGHRPIIWHIMKHYYKYNYKDFYLALGYKSNIIKTYFQNYHAMNSDFSVNIGSGKIIYNQNEKLNWNVHLINTGLSSLTGDRVRQLKDYIGNETFMLTYGDAVSNVNINNLLNFHKNHGKMVTLTAVRPAARFGELQLEQEKIISFKEKPQLNKGWINGGFFVIEPSFFDVIPKKNVMLEREPIENVAKIGELMAYKHYDFWQCMDTKRDHELLEQLWLEGAPWV